MAEAGQPFIGVGLRTITPQLAGQFGLPVEEGAVITEVFGGGAAAEAGLAAGDIVVFFCFSAMLVSFGEYGHSLVDAPPAVMYAGRSSPVSCLSRTNY